VVDLTAVPATSEAGLHHTLAQGHSRRSADIREPWDNGPVRVQGPGKMLQAPPDLCKQTVLYKDAVMHIDRHESLMKNAPARFHASEWAGHGPWETLMDLAAISGPADIGLLREAAR
jgi:hypothetical protein